jgi:enoyl-CoA hydratase/carnithine racemase
VNIVIPDTKCVVAEAIKLAQQITANSPDAVQATKHGLLLAQTLGPTDAVDAHIWGKPSERLYAGQNMKEGLRAFAEVCARTRCLDPRG